MMTEPSATKVCPMCAEQIQGEALVCRYCGFDYRVQRMPAAGTRYNGFAIASMVLGILWIYWIGSILAIVFGMIALGQIRDSEGAQGGRGMAIAGVVLGWIGIASLAGLVVLIIVGNASGW